MKAANKTFISSTFLTERIGYTAALACITEMERKKFLKQLSREEYI